MPRRFTWEGMTLVEVLVVVLIVSILAALALPSYQRYLQRGHRAEAVRGLLQISGCQERIRAGSGYYDTGRCAAGLDTSRYRFRIEPRDRDDSLAFVAFATPVAAQANDVCGELSLDQAGTHGIGGAAERLADCWGGR